MWVFFVSWVFCGSLFRRVLILIWLSGVSIKYGVVVFLCWKLFIWVGWECKSNSSYYNICIICVFIYCVEWYYGELIVFLWWNDFLLLVLSWVWFCCVFFCCDLCFDWVIFFCYLVFWDLIVDLRCWMIRFFIG